MSTKELGKGLAYECNSLCNCSTPRPVEGAFLQVTREPCAGASVAGKRWPVEAHGCARVVLRSQCAGLRAHRWWSPTTVIALEHRYNEAHWGRYTGGKAGRAAAHPSTGSRTAFGVGRRRRARGACTAPEGALPQSHTRCRTSPAVGIHDVYGTSVASKRAKRPYRSGMLAGAS